MAYAITDHPVYTVAMWQKEVANGDTRYGYAQWVESLKEWATVMEEAAHLDNVDNSKP